VTGPSVFPAPLLRWMVAPRPDALEVDRLATRLSLPPALAGLLVQRGQGSEVAARHYLRPDIGDLSDPLALAGMAEAVEAVVATVRAGGTIMVHGDYDVDGQCATALLTRALRAAGADVRPFLPHRLRDGYDFGPAGLEAAVAAGASLVITCDCGITAVETVRKARASGVGVVVTDHHLPGPELPPALAVIDPQRPDDRSGATALCGTGVAFKLLQALVPALGLPANLPYHLLDLVAFATVADVVPLVGENRILVKHGLRLLERTAWPGVRALIEASGLAGKEIRAGHVGFMLGPRLNAAGRIGEATDGLRLLLSDDPAESYDLAQRLEMLNVERQSLDRRILDEALAQVEEAGDPERDVGFVLTGDSWHPGVVGIVASRPSSSLSTATSAKDRVAASPASICTRRWCPAPTCWSATGDTRWRRGSPSGAATSTPSASDSARWHGARSARRTSGRNSGWISRSACSKPLASWSACAGTSSPVAPAIPAPSSGSGESASPGGCGWGTGISRALWTMAEPAFPPSASSGPTGYRGWRVAWSTPPSASSRTIGTDSQPSRPGSAPSRPTWRHRLRCGRRVHDVALSDLGSPGARMRIVAGEFGGRRLTVPTDARVRPTADRVREAWMSLLGDAVPGARVADLYAGSGALGLEALSRGASEVTFVEVNPASLRALEANITSLGVGSRVRVHRGEALRYVEQLPELAFDLVVADPPYTRDDAVRLVALFRKRPFARILSVEHRADQRVEGDAARRYGDTAITFCQAP
jgi:16S rRNA (guanine(966)-N(2))-methyltransferase RsmD